MFSYCERHLQPGDSEIRGCSLDGSIPSLLGARGGLSSAIRTRLRMVTPAKNHPSSSLVSVQRSFVQVHGPNRQIPVCVENLKTSLLLARVRLLVGKQLPL